MLSLFFPCMRLLQLQGSPAQLPFRPDWVWIVALLDIGLTIFSYHLLAVPSGPQQAIGAAMLHLSLLGGVLWLRSRTQRWAQTALALMGIWLLLDLLLLPPILVLAGLGVKLQAAAADGVATADTAGRFLDMLIIALLVWRLLAEGHVLKHALDLPMAAASTIALAMLVVETVLLQLWLVA